MNLLLDFDMFERGEREGAPAHMEWLAAFFMHTILTKIVVRHIIEQDTLKYSYPYSHGIVFGFFISRREIRILTH